MKFEDFKVGGRVLHDSCGKVSVVEITPSTNPHFRDDGLCIHVRYDAQKSGGQYDRAWFRMHPTTLTKLDSP